MATPQLIDEISPASAGRLREFIAARLGRTLELMRLLTDEDSPSGGIEGSSAVVDLLEDVAKATPGVTSVERILSPGYGEHLRVLAFTGEQQEGRPTVILGHTDTVHPQGATVERPWREENGRIYAAGIFDMKSSCALVFEALCACSTLGILPRRPVEVLLTCDEETSGGTGRKYVEEVARRAEHVLVLEPPAPGGRVKTARKGVGLWTLKAHGQAAHMGRNPEQGASAIQEIARQIEHITALRDETLGTTINIGEITGGTRADVVAAEAQASVDVRFTSTGEACRMEELLLALRPFDERVRLSISGGINCPPLERTDAVGELYERARGIALAVGFELGEAHVGGASDGNYAAAVGATVLDGLGVDGGGAHAADEHIVIDDIARRGALLAGLIASL
jgi:glutamate carboxypeptidase